MTERLTERYAKKIRGTLSCFDRVIITGAIPQIDYADAMTQELWAREIRVFDFTKFCEPLRDEIRENAERLAQDHGLKIQRIQRRNFRKKDRIREILRVRGEHPGLVHILTAVEACPSFRPWFNKKKRKAQLLPREAKCLHYYFYFIDEKLGLCYLRVPTWAPFRLQFYFNGHNHLAAKLRQAGIGFTQMENAFVEIEDFDRAQELADRLTVGALHRFLDRLARTYCPIIRHFRTSHRWGLMQVEYATDIVFKRRADLGPLYENLVRTAIHTVKPGNVATFLGRKLTARFQGEIGNDFHTRIEGTRIKHHMERVSIKMYDKQGIVLRIETTVNDVSFFKHCRKVVHQDGSSSMKVAPVRKTIYSLPALRELMGAANRRYLEFLDDLDDPTIGLKNLLKTSRRIRDPHQRSYRGFNLFDGDDLALFEALVAGQMKIYGFRNRHLRSMLPGKNSGQISRLLKSLRMHGLIKKVGNTYKYYPTKLGQKVILTALKLRSMYLIPALAHP